MLLSPASAARLALTLTAIVVALAGSAAGHAAGATLYVSTSGGTGPPAGPPYCPQDNPCGSIVTAVSLASPGDTISIGPGAFVEDYGVTISKNLTLVGAGPFGGTYVRSTLANKPVFTIEPGATVTISDLQIWKGAEGVVNAGDLTLDRVWVWKNQGTLDAGGIGNYGTLTVDRAVVAYNRTTKYQGGISSAGGIDNHRGTATISDSTIANNVGDPGGIDNGFNAKLTLTSSLVSGNSAPTDLGSWSTGGIDNSATAELTNVTITANVGQEVGGLQSNGGGSATLTNVTVARNGAPKHHVPDRAGGIAAVGSGTTITLWNTIVAANAGAECYRSDPTVTSILGGVSDLVDGSCGIFPSPGQPFDVPPRLFALKANGGPTHTLALRPDSPAIDAGSNDHCPATDQRGVTRPQDGNGDGTAVCDIGAYELTPIHIKVPITPIHVITTP